MKVVVFGATGSVGMQLVQQALDAGHEVTAFVRNPAKLSVSSPRLSVVQGDVLASTAPIEAAVAGQDIVFIALGAGLKGRVRSEGTKNIIAAMKSQGTNRLICQSTLGAGDSFGLLNLKWRLVFRGPLRWAMADHEKQESYVRDSGLDWTIVRPAAFTDGPTTGKYLHGSQLLKEKLTLKISRRNVAHFMLNLLHSTTYRSEAVPLSC